jgi:hypothetical protein
MSNPLVSPIEIKLVLYQKSVTAFEILRDNFVLSYDVVIFCDNQPIIFNFLEIVDIYFNFFEIFDGQLLNQITKG